MLRCKSGGVDVSVPTAGQLHGIRGFLLAVGMPTEIKPLKVFIVVSQEFPVDSSSQGVPRTVWSENAF